MTYTDQSPILSLPNEIFHCIAEKTSAYPVLRLVCKTFDDVISPKLFATISIRYEPSRLDDFVKTLQALADGSHHFLTHARSLIITCEICPCPEPTMNFIHDAELQYKLQVLDPYYDRFKIIEESLPRALRNFKLVTSATLHIYDYVSNDRIRACAIAGLSEIPSLTKFKLKAELYDGKFMNLRSLPSLEDLTIEAMYNTSISETGSVRGVPELIAKSPDLRRFGIICRYPRTQELGHPSFLSSLFQHAPHLNITDLQLHGFYPQLSADIIIHLRSLKSLSIQNALKEEYLTWSLTSSQKDLHFNQSPISGDIWNALRHHKIYLRTISVDEPTLSFIAYLSSYSGLVSLVIRFAAGPSVMHSDIIALQFYERALVTHQTTLENLDILPEFEGKWCFGEHNIDILTKLKSLKRLSMAIVLDFDPSSEYNPLHPVVRRRFHIVYQLLINSRAQCLLLRTATVLPNLSYLSISGARLASNHGEPCGSAWEHHNINPAVQIHDRVTSTGPLEFKKYKFTVYSSGHYYTLERVGGKEGIKQGAFFRAIGSEIDPFRGHRGKLSDRGRRLLKLREP